MLSTVKARGVPYHVARANFDISEINVQLFCSICHPDDTHYLCKPLYFFSKFSLTAKLLCNVLHKKFSTFGMKGAFHRLFHIVVETPLEEEESLDANEGKSSFNMIYRFDRELSLEFRSKSHIMSRNDSSD